MDKLPMFFRQVDDAFWHVVNDDRSDIETGLLVSECEAYAWTEGMFASQVDGSNNVRTRFVCRNCIRRAPYMAGLRLPDVDGSEQQSFALHTEGRETLFPRQANTT